MSRLDITITMIIDDKNVSNEVYKLEYDPAEDDPTEVKKRVMEVITSTIDHINSLLNRG